MKDILAYGWAIESSKQKVGEITDKTKTMEINALKISSCGPGQNWQPRKPQGTCDSQRTQSKTCGHYSGIWAHDRSKPCPAKGKECQSCGRHFSRVCRSNPHPIRDEKTSKSYQHVHKLDGTMVTPSDDSTDEYVYAVESQQCREEVQPTAAVTEIFQITRPKTTMKVGNYQLRVIIDSGASVNVIDKKDFDRLVQQNKEIMLRRTNTKIFAYGAEQPLPLVGAFDATVESVTCSTVAIFYVVSGNYGSLLGHETAVELELLQVDPAEIRTIKEQSDTAEKLKEEYHDIFQGIGKLKDFQFEIHIDENVNLPTWAIDKIDNQ